MPYEVRPLSQLLGAEVLGLDLRTPPTPALAEELSALLWKHRVLVFRAQQLSFDEQVAACASFGELEHHPLQENTCNNPYITVMSNVSADGKPLGYSPPPFELWHSDLCYLPECAKMTFLYAHTVPELGGETIFADQVAAHAALAPERRAELEGKRALFGSSHKLIERVAERGFELHIDPADMQPDVSHPVVRTHPYTGEKSLFINWTHTDAIEGLEPAASDALLSELYAHQEHERFRYMHSYERGDLIVWDNAATLHTATVTPPECPRIMHRVVVKGEAPR